MQIVLVEPVEQVAALCSHNRAVFDVPSVMSAIRIRLSSNMTPPLSTGGLVSWLTWFTLPRVGV